MFSKAKPRIPARCASLGPLWIFLLYCSLAFCPARAGAPVFAATVRPLAAILDELTSPRAHALCLLPPGASPHTYAPRPSDVGRLQDATLFWVSPALDGWAARLPAARRVEVLPLLPQPFRLGWEGIHDGHEHGHEEDHDGADPHFWTDPLAIKALLPALAAKLAEIDPAGAGVYAANAAAMAARMDRLDRELGRALAPVRGRPVVLFHPSFRYLLKRYGLPLAAVIEPAPGKEPGPRGLMELAAKIKGAGARSVFTEPQLPRRVAEAVAEAAGVRLYELNPLDPGPGGSIGDLLRANAATLRKGLE
ncbi:MAG: metal ABC transporter substrate-binding protein [Candidatus Sumerlaeia bacterium]